MPRPEPADRFSLSPNQVGVLDDVHDLISQAAGKLNRLSEDTSPAAADWLNWAEDCLTDLNESIVPVIEEQRRRDQINHDINRLVCSDEMQYDPEYLVENFTLRACQVLGSRRATRRVSRWRPPAPTATWKTSSPGRTLPA